MKVYTRQILFISLLFILTSGFYLFGQDLDLIDSSDIELLGEGATVTTPEEGAQEVEEVEEVEQVDAGDEGVNLTDLKEADDLDQLKEDIGEITQEKKVDEASARAEEDTTKEDEKKEKKEGKGPEIFDIGKEEKELLRLSKFVESKIPTKEWNEIVAASKAEKYVVQKGDWLWKICEKLFGSGFYYSKIWALNPHIRNPHEIEPGMVLIFDTGDADSLPNIQISTFDSKLGTSKDKMDKVVFDFNSFGEGAEPPWIEERKKLIDQGVYFQYISEDTYDDLIKLGEKYLSKEYERYEPPKPVIIIEEPVEAYDDSGFDKESKIMFDFREGFFLNTFVTTNIVQDFGEIAAIQGEPIFIYKFDTIYTKLDRNLMVKPGDKFSVYKAEGKVSHPISDRKGYRYTIVAQIETIKKINDKWECKVLEISGVVQRKDRITVYTPKINRILKTFNKRNIEAAIIGAYHNTANGLSFGEVVYLDRGRVDGVELGNVFEAYSFYDRGTEKKITMDPTYKIGEITVITLGDNFSTGLITRSSTEMGLGTIAITKTMEQVARATRVKNKELLKSVSKLEASALEELDVELNLDDISEDLLNRVDKIRLTEDELEELEQQEREKSVMKEHERDLRELEKLESEIVEVETKLGEAKLDEDKLLEQQNLDEIEKRAKEPDPNAFEALDEIELEIGRKYMDEDLNAKENPYGLTEFDLEEIDELLNTDTGSK